jgi:DNA-binding response OmpR family regulator
MAGLTPREAALLQALERHHGTVVSRATLAAETGLQDLSVRRVDALVSGVRRALGDDAIVTVRGRGWRLTTHA